jgi:malate permease and related proteins
MIELSYKLIPLIVLIALGWLTGRYLGMTRDSLAPLLIYLLTPLTIFKGVMDADLSTELLSLPLVYTVLCSIVCGISWWLGRFFFRSPSRNILAYGAGNANSGYFGFPAAVILLGPDALPTAVMISFGFVVFEATLGFFITARGHHTAGEAFRKLLRLPVMYVFAFAVALNALGFSVDTPAFEFLVWIKYSYSVLGMMLIGIALAQLERFEVDWTFTGFAFAMKFLVWPLITGFVLWIDSYFGLGFFRRPSDRPCGSSRSCPWLPIRWPTPVS